MPNLIRIDNEKAKTMLKRLERAIEEHKLAMFHLTAAITETEASRHDLHEAGLQCWVDKLDTENGP